MKTLKYQGLQALKVFHRAMWKNGYVHGALKRAISRKAFKMQVLNGVWKRFHEQKRNARTRGKK